MNTNANENSTKEITNNRNKKNNLSGNEKKDTNLEQMMANFIQNPNLDFDLAEFEMYKDPLIFQNTQNKNITENSNYNVEKMKSENENIKLQKSHSAPTPDGNNLTKNKRGSIISITEKNKLFTVKNIIGDKNSLYRAISEGILDSEEDFMMLKFFIANFACRKTDIEELYNGFYMDEFSLTFYEYLDRIKDDNFLVGEFDLILVSKIMNIEITIYSMNIKNNPNNTIDFNNDYSLYSSLKIINFLKCKKPYFTVDLLYNNLDDINDSRHTYHLLNLNKQNPFFKKILDKKNEFNISMNEIEFYDIKELENKNYIRDFYFTNFVAPEEEEKPKKKFNFKLPLVNISEDMKLTLIVIFVVLAFLTLRRMF